MAGHASGYAPERAADVQTTTGRVPLTTWGNGEADLHTAVARIGDEDLELIGNEERAGRARVHGDARRLAQLAAPIPLHARRPDELQLRIVDEDTVAPKVGNEEEAANEGEALRSLELVVGSASATCAAERRQVRKPQFLQPVVERVGDVQVDTVRGNTLWVAKS